MFSSRETVSEGTSTGLDPGAGFFATIVDLTIPGYDGIGFNYDERVASAGLDNVRGLGPDQILYRGQNAEGHPLPVASQNGAPMLFVVIGRFVGCG